jgi:iron complex outermembrane receptor protein
MINPRNFWIKLLHLFLVVQFAPLTVYSQALEEIVVTAQKREQSIQDVPISIAAVDGLSIQREGFRELEDLANSLPNVTITEYGLGDLLFIRGIGSGNNIGFEQSVGTFIDGIYNGRGLQTRNTFLDIERAEVLRGPQSTYFGNNTIAGALSIITRGPTEEWEGFGIASYEDGTGTKNIEGAVGGPITDTLGIRVAARFTDVDGYQVNTTVDDKEPAEKRKAIRVTMDWDPTDSFNATLKLQMESNETIGRHMQGYGCPPPDGQPPAGYCLGFGVLGPAMGLGPAIPDFTLDYRRNGGNRTSQFPTDDDFDDLLNRGASLSLNWDIGEHQVTAISGYSFYDDRRAQSAILLSGPFPTPVLPFANIEHAREIYTQYSQELRIISPTGGQFEYIAGLYYQSSDLNVTNDFSATVFATRLSQHDQDEKSFAAFGAITWNVNDQLRLTAGLRYTTVDKDVLREQILAENQGNHILADAIPMTPMNPLFGLFNFGFGWQNGILAASRTDDDVTPSFNLQYDWNDDLMTYFSYGQGFKAGGFDEQNGVMNPATIGFRPEQAETFEIGVKSSLLDGRMRLNVTAFHSEFTDLQVRSFDGVINILVSNAGSSITQGVEMDMLWQMSDKFQLGFQAAYTDAEWDDRQNGQCTTTQAAGLVTGCDFTDPSNPVQDQTGQPLFMAPEITANIGLTYSHPMQNGYQVVANLSGMFEDDFFLEDDNDPLTMQDGYVKLDAYVRLESPSNKWELSLIGKNLNDKLTSHFATDMPLSSGSYIGMVDRPRTIAIQGQYNW